MGELAIVLRTPADQPGTNVMGLIGPVTRDTAPALRDYLQRLLDTAPPPSRQVLLDMSCCTGIDVDGLLALAGAQQAARRHGGALHLTTPPPLIARQIRQHNFGHLLRHPTPEVDEPSSESRERDWGTKQGDPGRQ